MKAPKAFHVAIDEMFTAMLAQKMDYGEALMTSADGKIAVLVTLNLAADPNHVIAGGSDFNFSRTVEPETEQEFADRNR